MKRNQIIILCVVGALALFLIFRSRKATAAGGGSMGGLLGGTGMSDEEKTYQELLNLIPADAQGWIVDYAMKDHYPKTGDKALSVYAAIAGANPNASGKYNYKYGSITGPMLFSKEATDQLWTIGEAYKRRKAGW